mmetsp:Transcript_20632/g.30642  ORF Transcript_20632/g.30642 Transcript_20632/m.30642 type:complete len:93 (+) Transcript_20632:62-340(+)
MSGLAGDKLFISAGGHSARDCCCQCWCCCQEWCDDNCCECCLKAEGSMAGGEAWVGILQSISLSTVSSVALVIGILALLCALVILLFPNTQL